MIRTNLLAAERPAAKAKRAAPAAPGALQLYLFLALFGGGSAALCAGLYLLKANAIAKLDADIKTAEAEQIRLQAIKAQVDAFQRKRDLLQRKVELIERLRAAQADPVHMLDEISNALPEFVWLTGLDQGGPSVKFTGQSNGMTSVANFISKLGETTWFPRVELNTFTEDQNGLVTFALTGDFKNPKTAAQEKAAQTAAAAPPPPPAAKK